MLSAPSSRGRGQWQECPPGELLQVWEQPPFCSLHSSMSEYANTHAHTKHSVRWHGRCLVSLQRAHKSTHLNGWNEEVNSVEGWKSIRERLTNAGVSINVQLVAAPARAPERSLAVDANVLTVPVQHQALIHIWGIRHSQVTSQFLGKMWLNLKAHSGYNQNAVCTSFWHLFQQAWRASWKGVCHQGASWEAPHGQVWRGLEDMPTTPDAPGVPRCKAEVTHYLHCNAGTRFHGLQN